MRKFAVKLAAIFFAALLCYSGYRIWDIQKSYKAEADLHDSVMEYKPQAEDPVNQNVIDLQEKYPDVAGWLTIANTKIDYPFVLAKDNNAYLRRDLNGEYALAGTLFMDYRCERDFSSRNTIIYGHHMKNGSMFGTLKAFKEKAFFDENRTGTVFLPRATLQLDFFAFMIIKHTDAVIYSVEPDEDYLDYVKQNASHFRQPSLTDDSLIVTLSTCSYEFNNARMVLLATVR